VRRSTDGRRDDTGPMAGGWCGIEGHRGTDDRRSGTTPTTGRRRNTDGHRGGSLPTRRWQCGRSTPTTDVLKLLPQDLHHAYEGWTKEANNTTSDNKFVLHPPCSIDVDPNLLCTLLDFHVNLCIHIRHMVIRAKIGWKLSGEWNSVVHLGFRHSTFIYGSCVNWI
jgi:hypothetical protein